MFCGKCGKHVGVGSQFCNGCGSPAVANPHLAPQRNNPGFVGAPGPAFNNPNPVAYAPAIKHKPKIAPIIISFSLALIMLILAIPLGWVLDTLSPYSSELLAELGPVVVTGEFKSGYRNGTRVGYGTITFIRDGYFGAVAHHVPDIPSSRVSGHHFYNAEVMSVINEELQVVTRDRTVWGEILYNYEEGVFGRVSNSMNFTDAQEMEVGTAVLGSAQILVSTKPGPPQVYNIEIIWVDELNTDKSMIDGRNIWWRATDPDFPGVYGGNSGSPIIQDGKLVGGMSNASLRANRLEGAATSAVRMIGAFEENHFGNSRVSDAVASHRQTMMVVQVIYGLVIFVLVILGIVGIVRAVKASKKSKLNQNAWSGRPPAMPPPHPPRQAGTPHSHWAPRR